MVFQTIFILGYAFYSLCEESEKLERYINHNFNLQARKNYGNIVPVGISAYIPRHLLPTIQRVNIPMLLSITSVWITGVKQASSL